MIELNKNLEASCFYHNKITYKLSLFQFSYYYFSDRLDFRGWLRGKLVPLEHLKRIFVSFPCSRRSVKLKLRLERLIQ